MVAPEVPTAVPAPDTESVEQGQDLAQQNQEQALEIARLKGQLEGGTSAPAPAPIPVQTATPAPAPERIPTRSEIQSRIDADEITQDEGNRLIDEVTERRITQQVQAQGAIQLRDQQLNAEMALYHEHNNEIWQSGEVRDKVQTEFREICRINGGPPTPGSSQERAFELQAMRSVVGAPKAKVEETNNPPPVHVETGGGSGGEGPVHKTGTGAAAVPAKYRDHYQKGIDRGLYTGWDDPTLKAEIPHMRTES